MIKNTPTKSSKATEDLRGAIEHRAAWFYYLIDEAEKKGLDIEFAREAIFRCGCLHANTKYPKTDDLQSFAKAFANENVVDIFEMEILKNDGKELSIDFHYCPLVKAWMQLTDDEKRINTLCDIAMDGDRGIIDQYPAFSFELGDTIAKGCPVCQIRIKKQG